jgi:hypothetical protein
VRFLPDFEDTQIDADHLRQTSIVIPAEQLYKRFEAVRIGWQKLQAKKLKEKKTEDSVSAVKDSTFKGEKGNRKANVTQARKKRKLQH